VLRKIDWNQNYFFKELLVRIPMTNLIEIPSAISDGTCGKTDGLT
jgi:hypothetical protein